MNIVAHNHQSRELLSSKISRFLEEFHVGRILKACNAYQVRGFSVKDIAKFEKFTQTTKEIFMRR